MKTKSFPGIAGLVSFGILLSLCGCGKSSKPAAETRTDATPPPAASEPNKLAALAAEGEPVTLAELNSSYAEPPAGENAAEIYAQAFESMTPAKTADEAKTPAYLAKNQKALDLLLQAAGRKACRYPATLTDGSASQLPHLAKVKACASLLAGEAVSQAARGRTDASTRALTSGLALGRSLNDEPLLISRLVEIACVRISFQAMEDSLSRKAFTDAQLQELQGAVHEIEGSASLHRAIVGERAMAFSAFQMSADDLVKGLNLTNAGEKAMLVKYRESPAFQQDFDFAISYYSNLMVLVDMPFPQCLAPESQEMLPKIETARANGWQLSSMLLPALGNLNPKRAEMEAHIRATQTALAVERYRLKHANALPKSLDALLPDFLTTIPSDPYNGQPLCFKKLSPRGYVVYSAGKNGTDDGGVEKSADGKTQLDVTFPVRR